MDDWQSLRLGYNETDEEIDPWVPFGVVDAVTRFIADWADRSRQRTLLLYSDHLASYVADGGALIPIEDQEAWRKSCGIPWP